MLYEQFIIGRSTKAPRKSARVIEGRGFNRKPLNMVMGVSHAVFYLIPLGT